MRLRLRRAVELGNDDEGARVMLTVEHVNRLKEFLQEEGHGPKEAIELMACLMAAIATGNHIPLSQLAEGVTAVIMAYQGESPSGDLTHFN